MALALRVTRAHLGRYCERSDATQGSQTATSELRRFARNDGYQQGHAKTHAYAPLRQQLFVAQPDGWTQNAAINRQTEFKGKIFSGSRLRYVVSGGARHAVRTASRAKAKARARAELHTFCASAIAMPAAQAALVCGWLASRA